MRKMPGWRVLRVMLLCCCSVLYIFHLQSPAGQPGLLADTQQVQAEDNKQTERELAARKITMDTVCKAEFPH